MSVLLKHTCGCVAERENPERRARCQHHGMTSTYALAGLNGSVEQAPEGPRPSTSREGDR